ncbi:MAG: YihY/virulence factor BrkB family protein [Rickettsiales bacterium]|nr:YihY/virulence factor BrkB family protein [Rickettsiales bacterium]
MLGIIKTFFNRVQKNIFVKTFIDLLKDEGLEYAGYLAYLNIFSLFPLFIILSIIIGEIADNEISNKFIDIVLSNMPNYSKLINEQIHAIIKGPSTRILSIASIGALWTTTSSLEGFRTAFNKIYKVKSPPFFISSRLLSMLQFIIMLIIFIATIFGLIIFPKILIMLGSLFNIEITNFINFKKYNISSIATVSIIFISVATLYYSFTNKKKLTFISVLPGSAITTIVWIITAKVMGYYLKLQLAELSVVYGSLGGILSVLLFFYVANIILLYGAEFNYLISRKH